MLTVTVIIPTYCRYECLGPLLEGLAGQSRAAHEILVADQSPDDLAHRGFRLAGLR